MTDTADATSTSGTSAHQHAEGVKCEMCDMAMPMPVAVDPSGSATTFEELDALRAAAEQAEAVDDVMRDFDTLYGNIRYSYDLTPAEKAARIQSLAEDLAGRIADARASEAAESEDGMRATKAAFSDTGGLAVFKDVEGAWRWIAIYSNRYEDREGEIFSEAAHKAYASYVASSGDYPTFRLWHIPLDVGKADLVDYSDGFMVASGTFLPEMADVAKNLAAEPDLGCSHGFRYYPEDLRDGVYHRYRSHEISALPRERAANLLTAFSAGQEAPMLSPQAKEFFERVAGPERTAAVEASLDDLKAVADQSGVAYKSWSDFLAASFKDDEDAAAVEAATDGAEGAQEGEGEAAEGGADPEGAATGDEPEGAAADAETPSEEDIDAADKAMAAAEPIAASKQLLDGIKEMFAEAVAPLTAELEAQRGLIEQQGQRLAELEKSDDERIAGRFRPRHTPIPAGKASSDADDNLVDNETAERLRAMAKPDDGADAGPAAGYLNDLKFLAGR